MTGYKISRILSIIFSPLIVPTYALALVMFTSFMAVLPHGVLWVIVAVIALTTAALPLGALLVLRRLGMITDLDVSDRSQRLLPILIILICYASSWLFLSNLQTPPPVLRMWTGAIVATLLILLISPAWKISAHCAAMGAMACMIGLEMSRMLTVCNLFPIFVVSLLLTGAVASARVWLGCHTVMQTIAGAVLGAAAIAVSFFI